MHVTDVFMQNDLQFIQGNFLQFVPCGFGQRPRNPTISKNVGYILFIFIVFISYNNNYTKSKQVYVKYKNTVLNWNQTFK